MFQSLKERTLSRAGISVLYPAMAVEESVLYKEFVKAQEYYNKEMAKVV